MLKERPSFSKIPLRKVRKSERNKKNPILSMSPKRLRFQMRTIIWAKNILPEMAMMTKTMPLLQAPVSVARHPRAKDSSLLKEKMQVPQFIMSHPSYSKPMK